MTFVFSMRHGPARLAQRLAATTTPSKPTMSTATKSLHRTLVTKTTTSSAAASAAKPWTSRISMAAAARSAFTRSSLGAARRFAHHQQGFPSSSSPEQIVSQAGGSTMRKLLVGGAVFGGSLVMLNAVFNRETRDDGGMPVYEREYLNATFLHTGLGIGIIGLTAQQMVRTGFVYRIMVTNPWVMMIGGLALSFGTMIAATSISPENYIPKYAMWTAFNATQAAFVAPMLAFIPMPVLARAGLYTVAMMGSLAVVGATAKQEKYLYIGGPLLAGLAVVVASGFAPLLIPATAVRTLAVTENLWLYGGLAVFGGFTLYDVQKVLHHARLAEAGRMVRDPIRESISLELDFLNIFIRMVQILAMNQNRK